MKPSKGSRVYWATCRIQIQLNSPTLLQLLTQDWTVSVWDRDLAKGQQCPKRFLPLSLPLLLKSDGKFNTRKRSTINTFLYYIFSFEIVTEKCIWRGAGEFSLHESWKNEILFLCQKMRKSSVPEQDYIQRCTLNEKNYIKEVQGQVDSIPKKCRIACNTQVYISNVFNILTHSFFGGGYLNLLQNLQCGNSLFISPSVCTAPLWTPDPPCHGS